MARQPLIRTDCFAYHVTSRSNNKEWFYIPIEISWTIFVEKLALTAQRYGTEIWAFVLMSNHFHLLLSTPNRNLDQAMRFFHTEVCRAIQKQSQRINHVFGGRYRWTVLDSPKSVAYTLKYIHRNPVRAGLCERVEQYPYNAHFRVGDPQPLPLMDGLGNYWNFVPKGDAFLRWVNEPSSIEQEELIQKALRRFTFEFSTNSNAQKSLRLLKRSYGVESELL